MKHLSIRWRLTLWYAAAMGTVLTGFCVILLLLMRQQLLARTDAGLREELQELALEVRLAKSKEEFDEHVQARFFQHDIYDFLVSDENGKLLFGSSRLKPELAALIVPQSLPGSWQFTNLDLIDAKPYRVASTFAEGPPGRVIVQAITPLKPLYEELQTLQLLMGILLPLGTLFALCGGYFLARRALAPVEQIVQVAASITITDLDQRIEVTNPHDELGRLAKTLNSLIARLEQAVAEIRRFTADASHELRTPLAVLRSEAECALRKLRSPEEYQRTLTVVVEEATRLGRLADQLLSLSRHDAGITECRLESIRIDALLSDVVEQLRPLAAERNVMVDLNIVESCEFVGDDIRLSQAFFNVVDNAIKYTPEGGAVEVQCQVKDWSAMITVRDTGIGISPEHLGRVFDRFYRVDSSRHTGGAGLGLAITRTAVHAHKGEIDIHSELRIGTTVTIRLPGVSTMTESASLTQHSAIVPNAETAVPTHT